MGESRREESTANAPSWGRPSETTSEEGTAGTGWICALRPWRGLSPLSRGWSIVVPSSSRRILNDGGPLSAEWRLRPDLLPVVGAAAVVGGGRMSAVDVLAMGSSEGAGSSIFSSW